MFSALVSADTAPTSGFAFVNLLILIILVGAGYPLFRKLRRSISENRRRRWIEEGLMDPPADEPRADGPSTEPRGGPSS